MNCEPPIRLCIKCRKKPAVSKSYCSHCLIRMAQCQRKSMPFHARSLYTKTARAEYLKACGQPLR
jgi:hypothetical protein